MIIAVPSDKESIDPFYFIKIIEECQAECDLMDDYKNSIKEGQKYLSGQYLEKSSCSPKGVISFYPYEKKCFFFPESIVFPFAPFKEGKKGTRFITEDDYTHIILFVQQTKMSNLAF